MGNNYVLILLQQGYVQPFNKYCVSIWSMILHLCHCFVFLFLSSCRVISLLLFLKPLQFHLWCTIRAVNWQEKLTPRTHHCCNNIGNTHNIGRTFGTRFSNTSISTVHVACLVFWCTHLIKVAICKDLFSGFRAILQQYCSEVKLCINATRQ